MIPPDLKTPPFAEYLETIKMLYRIDDDFKTLCDDYVTSKRNEEKLKSFEKSFELPDRQNELEYKQLSKDLEKEILDYVNNIR